MRLQVKFVTFASASLSTFFFSSYIKISYLDFISNNTAHYIRNIIDNVDHFFIYYFRSVMTVIIEIPVVIIIISILFYVDPMGSLVFGTTALFLGLFFFIYYKKQLTLFGANINRHLTDRLSYINKSFGLYKEIQLSNTENFYSNTFF